jgi:hypothetical protein
VETAARNILLLQQRQAIMAELDLMINPPPPEPEPEPETVYDPWEEVRRGWQECSRRYQREQELKQLKSK